MSIFIVRNEVVCALQHKTHTTLLNQNNSLKVSYHMVVENLKPLAEENPCEKGLYDRVCESNWRYLSRFS